MGLRLQRRLFATCPYTILGVTRAATKPQIRKAYLDKVMLNHPDRFVNVSDAEKQRRQAEFVQINRAYEILSKHRKEFDAGRFEQEQTEHQQRTHNSRAHQQYAHAGFGGQKYAEYWARRARYEQTGEGENPKIYGPNTAIMMGILGISSLLGYLSYQRKMYMFRNRTR
jgi:molecular chaperone DnaJ